MISALNNAWNMDIGDLDKWNVDNVNCKYEQLVEKK